jgi:hypothetical protein
VARFKTKCAGHTIKVNDVDHLPAHCHVLNGMNVLVALHTLEIIRPAGATLTSAVRSCLRKHQMEMLRAWEQVEIMNGTEQE